ncbi:SGNH/GDSL hydrolase family protein [Gandjariella thermophila]|uniref:Lipase n=1 Tax=Gandjariella thermophila TaxID=1931992 RepID=A0A4D4JC29_9PSEU|nr:SGNH/GDSL hydrolase family protein [Gandjariella thermophila]GDY32218.1 lipase [Gandjariella thermophila]
MSGPVTVARRRSLTVLGALTVLFGLLLGTPGVAAASNPYSGYVALGDSYASGPFIPYQRTDPVGCFRSDRNYPSLVAKALHVTAFSDASCGGATTADMTESQSILFGSNPPQFDALRPDTRLVTVTIGGNDIGFSDIVLRCAAASLVNPLGAPCREQYTEKDGTDELAARIAATAPKIARVLDGIHRRSPRARVLLVGYLRILPEGRGCWPLAPFARGDVPYLDGVERQLNAMLGAQAVAHHAGFVDPYPASSGHDVCEAPAARWVEGLIPTSPAFPVHPNAAGMAAVAGAVLGALGAASAPLPSA